MEFLQPSSWADALAAKAEHPDAFPVAGGTDVMVEMNFGHTRPPALLDLTRVGQLAEWGPDDGMLRLGAGLTYARIIEELGTRLPGLAMASRTVGSPQIRNRGTVGGNLGSASPAGDAHPPLLATDAVVEIHSLRAVRRVAVADFFTGPKANVLDPDELIAAFLVRPGGGPEQFSKIGTRNAMVIAACSFSIALHPAARRTRTGLGSAAPTPLRALDAEAFLDGSLEEHGLWDSRAEIDAATLIRFGDLVADAAAPIDDVRAAATYRSHALSVLARRTLTWAWEEFRSSRADE